MATYFKVELVVQEDILNELLYALDKRMDHHWTMWKYYETQDDPQWAEHRRQCRELGTLKRTIVHGKELLSNEVLS